MSDVAGRIKRRIAQAGPMTVAEYMAACLTDPDGYYATREPFGRAGDFVTAPDVSQVFGELIGAFLVECWQRDGAPDPFDLVEFGPGRGTLMADVLRTAALAPAFLRACRVVLIEASPRLRKVQMHKLSALHGHMTFASDLPDERPVYAIANEFVDALPVRQLVRQDGRWHERVVGLSADGALSFGLAPYRIPVALDAEDGAVIELRPAAERFARDLAATAVRHGKGVALIIDYGYLRALGGETLQAVRDHRFVDVLDGPGTSDLSAHVDFGALAAAALEEGATVHGPRDQGDWLVSLGLLERAGALGQSADAAGRAAIEAAVTRLAGDGPHQMGTLFKALAIHSGEAPPPGFAVETQRRD